MAEILLGNAGLWYLAALVGGFTVVALWETWRPLRQLSAPLVPRWRCNIALLFLNQAVLQWALPLLTLSAALLADARAWGLLQRLDLPALLAVPAGLLILDALRWALHRVFHHWPWLWRLHRVHHSDLDYDCTIGLRFHPLEAVLTQLTLVGLILLLGLPPLAVLLSDVLTLALGYVVHGNISLPPRWDATLRRWLVTPDLHRVHHSVRLDESRSNFGSLLSVWDRMFGSYRAQPADGHLGMRIGLAEWREPQQLTLPRLLWMPFRR